MTSGGGGLNQLRGLRKPKKVEALVNAVTSPPPPPAAIGRAACGPGGWIAAVAPGTDEDEEEAFPEEAANEWKESLCVAETLAGILADEEDALRSAADDALRVLAPHEATLRRTFAWDSRRTVLSTSVTCLRYFAEAERA